MRRALFLTLLLACLAGCRSKPEGDVTRASMMDDLKDLVYGKDRGLWSYRSTISANVTSLSGPYQYPPPKAWVSQYRVERAAYGLGGTKTENAEQLAQVVDTLFHLMRNDPTATIRATACRQLGRVLLRLAVDTEATLPPDAGAEEQINSIAQDLFAIKQKLDKGEKVKVRDAVALLEQLAAMHPPRMSSAVQVVRACAIPPIAGTARGPLFDLREKEVPNMVRDSILVSLRERACGDLRTMAEPDPEAMVRADAIDVLARIATPAAIDNAVARLDDPIDPPERDFHVRGRLLHYLGMLGGRKAFASCVMRLGDVYQDVRYHAQVALTRMTGARGVEPTAEAWNAWLEQNPSWRPVASKG
jgi:hypothetical protein